MWELKKCNGASAAITQFCRASVRFRQIKSTSEMWSVCQSGCHARCPFHVSLACRAVASRLSHVTDTTCPSVSAINFGLRFHGTRLPSLPESSNPRAVVAADHDQEGTSAVYRPTTHWPAVPPAVNKNSMCRYPVSD